MGWDTVTPGDVGSHEPLLIIYRGLSSRINAAADEQFFTDAEAVRLHVDTDRKLLWLEPVVEPAPDAYTISRDNTNGGTLSSRRALERVGLEQFDLEGSTSLELVERDGRIIADLSVLPPVGDGTSADSGDPSAGRANNEAADSGDESANDTGAADKGGELPPPSVAVDTAFDADHTDRQTILDYLTGVVSVDGEIAVRASAIAGVFERFSSRVVGQHLSVLADHADDLDIKVRREEQTSGAAIWHIAPAVDKPGEIAGGGALEEVRNTARADYVGSIDALAEHLDVTPDRARRLALDANVYADLTDSPPEGGYGRGNA